MEKMVMIPECRYNKMLESYDNAVSELQRLKNALLDVRNGSDSIEFMTDSAPGLESVFEHYTADLRREQVITSEPLKRALGWFEEHEAELPEEIASWLIAGLADYEKQWFVNGFRCASRIWKAC